MTEKEKYISERLEFLDDWEFEVKMADILTEDDKEILRNISIERQELIAMRG